MIISHLRNLLAYILMKTVTSFSHALNTNSVHISNDCNFITALLELGTKLLSNSVF